MRRSFHAMRAFSGSVYPARSPKPATTASARPGRSPGIPSSRRRGEAILGAGDVVALAIGPVLPAPRLGNAGSEPLVFVESWIVAGHLGLAPLSPTFDCNRGIAMPRVTQTAAAEALTVRVSRATPAADEVRRTGEGTWQRARAGADSPTHGTTQRADGSIRNISGEPVLILILTAEFAPVSGPAGA